MDLPDSANIALETVCENLPNGGERRPGQEAMTRMVAESIISGNHLVVRAGTGTGKSLAYLLPSILCEKPTIVATATKALQDQLAQKDLPDITRNEFGGSTKKKQQDPDRNQRNYFMCI